MSTPQEQPAQEFDINAEARANGGYLNMPQIPGEPDRDYRERIAGVLRERGQIVEAHEVITGRRYDDPEQGDLGPMTGIIGALAQEWDGRKPMSHDPERQVGDDIAYGVLARAGEDPGRQAIAAIFGALGPKAGMDVVDGFGKDSHLSDQRDE